MWPLEQSGHPYLHGSCHWGLEDTGLGLGHQLGFRILRSLQSAVKTREKKVVPWWGGPGVLRGRFQSSDSWSRRRLYFINKRKSNESHCNEGNIFFVIPVKNKHSIWFFKNRTIMSAAFSQTRGVFRGLQAAVFVSGLSWDTGGKISIYWNHLRKIIHLLSLHFMQMTLLTGLDWILILKPLLKS